MVVVGADGGNLSAGTLVRLGTSGLPVDEHAGQPDMVADLVPCRTRAQRTTNVRKASIDWTCTPGHLAFSSRATTSMGAKRVHLGNADAVSPFELMTPRVVRQARLRSGTKRVRASVRCGGRACRGAARGSPRCHLRLDDSSRSRPRRRYQSVLTCAASAILGSPVTSGRSSRCAAATISASNGSASGGCPAASSTCSTLSSSG